MSKPVPIDVEVETIRVRKDDYDALIRALRRIKDTLAPVDDAWHVHTVGVSREVADSALRRVKAAATPTE